MVCGRSLELQWASRHLQHCIPKRGTGGAAGALAAGQQAAGKVSFRRRIVPDFHLDIGGFESGVEAVGGFQRRGNQVGQRLAARNSGGFREIRAGAGSGAKSAEVLKNDRGRETGDRRQ